jgi:5-bromo-4-chloroindolyl phosphate hydrolysis protein
MNQWEKEQLHSLLKTSIIIEFHEAAENSQISEILWKYIHNKCKELLEINDFSSYHEDDLFDLAEEFTNSLIANAMSFSKPIN